MSEKQAPAPSPPPPCRLFIAYARKDASLLAEFRAHLVPLEHSNAVQTWCDSAIQPGEEWQDSIRQQLQQAHVVLLLLSSDAIASGFCQTEIAAALLRHQRGESKVVPLVVRPCDWKNTPLKDLQALPKDGKPVITWQDRDEAWLDAVERLRTLLAQSAALPAPAAQDADPFRQVMVKVEGGSFTMGCQEFESEKPLRQVSVRSFFLASCPVTQEQWEQVMGSGSNPGAFRGSGSLPVDSASWRDAQAFIRKLNEAAGTRYRLPAEAEWEFAASGGVKGGGCRFAGSQQLEQVGWWRANSGGKTQPVRQKLPNELGLHDLSGNVWEWCEDDWHDSYLGAPSDGSAWLRKSAFSHKVLRGGSWESSPDFCRVAARLAYPASIRHNHTGFRVAHGLH